MREIHLIRRDARLVRPHQWAFSRAPNRDLAYITDARAVRPYKSSEISLVYLGNLNCPPKLGGRATELRRGSVKLVPRQLVN